MWQKARFWLMRKWLQWASLPPLPDDSGLHSTRVKVDAIRSRASVEPLFALDRGQVREWTGQAAGLLQGSPRR